MSEMQTAPTDRQGSAASALRLAPGYSAATLAPAGELIGANGMRVGPDGRLYVAQAFGSQITAIDLTSRATHVVSRADGPVIAPDDLAFDSHGALYATEVMSARVSAIRPNGRVDVIAGDLPVANGITVHADRIFMSEFNPEGRIWELFPDGSTPRLIAAGLMMPNALSLGPDGYLYFPLVPLGEIWRVDARGGAAERVVGGLDIPTAVKFDSHGALFAVEAGSGAIARIDPARGTAMRFAQVAYGIDNLAFAPDGRMFVSHFTDGEIAVVSPDGSAAPFMQGSLCGPFGLCADRAGGLVVADGMSVACIDPAGRVDRPGMLLQHGFPGYVRGVAMAGDDAFVVTNSAGQCARYRPGGAAEILAESLDEAMGVLVDGEEILVCEAGAGRVLSINAKGEAQVVCSGLQRPTGVARAADGGLLVSEAGAGRLVHICGGEARSVLTGMDEPHGVATDGATIYVLDRVGGVLHGLGPDGAAHVIARGVSAGAQNDMTARTLPGIADLMPGPLLPFSDIAVLADGRIAIGADRTGEILTITAA